MDWSYVVVMACTLGAVLLGVWLRGGAAEQAERRHDAERQLDAHRIAGLEAQLRESKAARAAEGSAAGAVVAAERRVSEAAALGGPGDDAGAAAGDRLLLGAGPDPAAPSV